MVQAGAGPQHILGGSILWGVILDCIKMRKWASRMAIQVKVLATNSDDLSSISRTNVVEGELPPAGCLLISICGTYSPLPNKNNK